MEAELTREIPPNKAADEMIRGQVSVAVEHLAHAMQRLAAGHDISTLYGAEMDLCNACDALGLARKIHDAAPGRF